MADNNRKWDCSDGYIWNFNQWRQDAYYLSTVIFNDGKKEEMKIDADEKGYYLKMLDSSTSDSSKQKISDIERAYGLDGLYDWYTIKDNTVKDTNAGKIMAIDEMDMSTADKGFYLSKYLNSLSKQAEEILANDGYEALYWYYYDKTEKDRQELQTRTDLLKSILYN